MKKFLEAHNGLCAKLINNSNFDGIWESSLTDSASKGLPDTELVSGDSRLHTIREIKEASSKPIIVDWDTGGQIGHFPYWVKRLRDIGVWAIVIEDKAFPKINSLKEGNHILEDVDKFCEKIRAGNRFKGSMRIIARVESLIARKSLYDALIRSEAYLEAGADGILIHSKQKVDATEVMEFAKEFKKKHPNTLLACVPTTYELPKEHLFDIVIYANHLLRASLEYMRLVIDSILENNGTKQLEGKIADIEEIFQLTGDKNKCTQENG